MTALKLLDDLRTDGVRLAVEDGELVLYGDPTSFQVDSLTILRPLVRAVLTGRKCYGCGSVVGRARPVELWPGQQIPSWVTLLAVEGDANWERLQPEDRELHPGLFDRREEKQAA